MLKCKQKTFTLEYKSLMLTTNALSVFFKCDILMYKKVHSIVDVSNWVAVIINSDSTSECIWRIKVTLKQRIYWDDYFWTVIHMVSFWHKIYTHKKHKIYWIHIEVSTMIPVNCKCTKFTRLTLCNCICQQTYKLQLLTVTELQAASCACLVNHLQSIKAIYTEANSQRNTLNNV